jgi:PKD domain-containing protein
MPDKVSFGRSRLPDYSIGATVLFVTIALPFFVFTRTQHLHRLTPNAPTVPSAIAIVHPSAPATPDPTTSGEPSLQPKALPLTADSATARARAAGTSRKASPSSTAAAPTTTPAPSDVSTPTPVPDAPPVAVFAVSPLAGPSPLAVTADASASTDTDQTPIVQVFVNFGDGNTLLADSKRRATHTYTTAGSYTVTITVIDSGRNASTASQTVVVG